MSLTLDALAIYKNNHLMLQVSTHIAAGMVTSVMGPSGVGKSTLLDAISGQLSRPFSMTGQVMVNGHAVQDMPAYQRQIGMLYQDPLLFEHLTVSDNIRFAIPKMQQKRLGREQVESFIAEQLNTVGLADIRHRAVQTLSGGQQARVALLRTLAANPQAVLLDEPFSKLDSTLRQQTREWVFAQLQERSLPALMVTHDIEDANSANGEIIEVSL
ncbi:ATP-binding cassette domain-containing protein [Alteromonas sp. 14N.309.X.WAT.G.H12]|uniref:ATP-binding cassette domain-containing protein n=1 Tax=Alteromonas sp. 14N.309.X.WAT.G.H12 TaxID=3120824 RepID=UPI002FD040A9